MIKNKFAKSKVLLIIGIILIVVLATAGIGLFVLFSDTTLPAVLKYESGEVYVDNGKGYNQVSSDTNLKLNSKVKTGADGAATLVLFESSITDVEPNTEISIEKLVQESPKLKQTSGTTWNKFTSLSGMESMEIETPSTVATVRGTGYEVSMDGVKVSDGTVEVRAEGETYTLNEEDAVVKEKGKWQKRKLTQEEMEKMKKKLQKSIETLKQLRLAQIEKHKTLYEKAKQIANFTDEKRDRYFNQVDSGKRDPDQDFAMIKDRLPIKHPALEKIIAISKAIQKENKKIEKLESIKNKVAESETDLTSEEDLKDEEALNNQIDDETIDSDARNLI